MKILSLRDFKKLSNWLNYEKCMASEYYQEYIKSILENSVSSDIQDFCYDLAFDMDFLDYDCNEIDNQIRTIDELNKFLETCLNEF